MSNEPRPYGTKQADELGFKRIDKGITVEQIASGFTNAMSAKEAYAYIEQVKKEIEIMKKSDPDKADTLKQHLARYIAFWHPETGAYRDRYAGAKKNTRKNENPAAMLKQLKDELVKVKGEIDRAQRKDEWDKAKELGKHADELRKKIGELEKSNPKMNSRK